jgi:hypothetical protein
VRKRIGGVVWWGRWGRTRRNVEGGIKAVDLRYHLRIYYL